MGPGQFFPHFPDPQGCGKMGPGPIVPHFPDHPSCGKMDPGPIVPHFPDLPGSGQLARTNFLSIFLSIWAKIDQKLLAEKSKKKLSKIDKINFLKN